MQILQNLHKNYNMLLYFSYGKFSYRKSGHKSKCQNSSFNTKITRSKPSPKPTWVTHLPRPLETRRKCKPPLSGVHFASKDRWQKVKNNTSTHYARWFFLCLKFNFNFTPLHEIELNPSLVLVFVFLVNGPDLYRGHYIFDQVYL